MAEFALLREPGPGKCDHRLLGISPEKARNLADDVNFFGTEVLGDSLDVISAGVAIGPYSYFDQFMVVESIFDFGYDIFVQAFVTNHHDRIQWMS
jgi:hypothetical protein